MEHHPDPGSPTSLASDTARQQDLFGAHDLLPLWIAETYVPLSPDIRAAMVERAHAGWYGYETRPGRVIDAFWDWMQSRHGWVHDGLQTSVSPSIGTSIAVLIDQLTDPGDGVILQPPVFTDFKPLVTRAGRNVVRNPLVYTDDGYRMDLEALESLAADPSTRFMILCNPHNPVGRVWSTEELADVAAVCGRHDVFVLVDEVHADIVLAPHRFTPFAAAAEGTGVSWAATHGPIKTFGLAGVCDTLLITGDDAIARTFREVASRLHLNRNNVFALAAFETAYRTGGPWLDGLLRQVGDHASMLRSDLPDPIAVSTLEGTYLAWIDFRALGLDVPDLAEWLVKAGIALSPGHWFGREGAGFARMTIAAPSATVSAAIRLLDAATQL